MIVFEEVKAKIYYLARLFGRWYPQYERDELVNEAWLRLKRYDVNDEGVLWAAVKRAFIAYHKSQIAPTKHRVCQQLDRYLPVDEHASPRTGLCTKDKCAAIDLTLRLEDCYHALTLRQLHIVIFRTEGYSLRQIARLLNISFETARLDMVKIRNLLRQQT